MHIRVRMPAPAKPFTGVRRTPALHDPKTTGRPEYVNELLRGSFRVFKLFGRLGFGELATFSNTDCMFHWG